jgi:hypothetical protein
MANLKYTGGVTLYRKLDVGPIHAISAITKSY